MERNDEKVDKRISCPFYYLIGSGRSIFVLWYRGYPVSYLESRTISRVSAEAIIRSSL